MQQMAKGLRAGKQNSTLVVKVIVRDNAVSAIQNHDYTNCPFEFSYPVQICGKIQFLTERGAYVPQLYRIESFEQREQEGWIYQIVPNCPD